MVLDPGTRRGAGEEPALLAVRLEAGAAPGATVLSFDGDRLVEIAAAETEHVKVTRAFLANPERWLKDLLDDAT